MIEQGRLQAMGIERRVGEGGDVARRTAGVGRPEAGPFQRVAEPPSAS